MNNEDAVKLFLSSQDSLGRDFEPMEKPRKPMDNFDGKYAALKFRLISEGMFHDESTGVADQQVAASR